MNTIVTSSAPLATPSANAGSASAAVGINSAGANQAEGLGNLFAMQLGNLLADAQPGEAVLEPGENSFDEEQLATMNDLLTLLQQLVNGTGASPQQLEQLPEQLQASESLPFSAQTQAMRLSEEQLQQITAALTQQGLSQQDANKAAAFMAALAQTAASEQQPSVRELMQQAKALLEQLGVEVVPQENTAETSKKDKVSNLLKTNAHFLAQTRSTDVNSLQTESATSQNWLKVNAALSSYQNEAAVTVKSTIVPSVAEQSGNELTDSGSMMEATPLTPQSAAMPQTGNSFAAQLQQTEPQHVRSANFLQDMANVFVKQMKVVEQQGISEAKLILHPESLGQIDVKITSNNGVITAHFTADTSSGKELLDNQLQQLRHALVQQGLQVDRLEVTQQQDQPQLAFQQQQREQARQQQEDGRQQNKNKQEEQEEFSLESLVDTSGSLSSLRERLRQVGTVEYSV
ncbi:flagellar hook-length control protein FliK [Brevibacillus fulvus]|uniref:Flagellar hook-length control protein FliK n=1 Tax=Brevibacillus fulvus TaxID=1125967 RepID=A0A938XZW4_9BACL|nr:flagellar hook-length control protein FliK [Brevibacillus fulvus]MBM7590623.1 flagellar hook-length control protein FliK [Brevibacillus fulvus]